MPEKRRLRVYVAGPISQGDLGANIRQATAAGKRLIEAGFAPLIPHLTCYYDGDPPRAIAGGIPHEAWLDVDLPWVAAADALLRLPGESAGAGQEVSHAIALGIPVYTDIHNLIGNPPPRRELDKKPANPSLPGDPRFHALLSTMARMHATKQADYGLPGDPFANIRASEEIGVPAWKGAWLRARDKVKRLDAFCVKGTLHNEGAEDSWLDLAAYCLICLILHRESIAEVRP